MRRIDLIVIHCSASDRVTHDNVETIRNWHIFDRGFSDIGYHYVITKDGKCHVGRDVHVMGAHAKGQNRHSIGICLTGLREFTQEQFKTAKEVIKELCKEHGLRPIDVVPHCSLNKEKTCPNFNIYEEILCKEF